MIAPAPSRTMPNRERARTDAKRPNPKHAGPPPGKKKKWHPAD